MDVHQFNAMASHDAAELVRPCLDIPRWVDAVTGGRPYADAEAVLAGAEQAADPFTTAEVDQALAHHPRIGERAAGASAEAALSRGEQSGLRTDDDIAARLLEGNRRYEQRFGRVFLIRAAGRTSEEILHQLTARLGNDDDTEREVVADQLRQIAVLRLRNLFDEEG